MTRESLINRLVARKMASDKKGQIFCAFPCLARKTAGAPRAAATGSKR
jgi:hypothetical protein